MSALLDTHILLWALLEPEHLADSIRQELETADEVWFSAVSIWEVAIKQSLGRPDFTANPYDVRTEALAIGFRELLIDGLQAAAVSALPRLHSDPFDRLLVAQAQTTGRTLWSHDPWVIQYAGPIRAV
ncbi:MAG: type II toxin-antitoxin system VapC family toxin [Propionibacteriaceae bacterium]|jgi:PIN domain nuclease of toxin-antitoxin system|nr:type II toxin-antitoxin system VapC family toxin [Propionibacteriaceae bacterium]